LDVATRTTTPEPKTLQLPQILEMTVILAMVLILARKIRARQTLASKDATVS
jgi:hypothetical protein